MREKVATLTEIETSWSHYDMMSAKAILDYESDAHYLYDQQAKRKAKKK